MNDNQEATDDRMVAGEVFDVQRRIGHHEPRQRDHVGTGAPTQPRGPQCPRDEGQGMRAPKPVWLANCSCQWSSEGWLPTTVQAVNFHLRTTANTTGHVMTMTRWGRQ